jgi:pimeloyl-ACP methyl ester carboxylesterase
MNIDIDNYYEQQGTGTPIVFIHGSYATTSTWKKMIDRLSLNHRCISVKLPGHGSAPEPGDFSKPTIDTELEILSQIVNELTDEPIHLVGHSFGGVIALAQALKGNLNVSQVTLFEPVAVWVLKRAQDEKMGITVKDFLKKYRHDVSMKVPYACGQVIDFWGGDGAFEALPGFIKDSMEPLTENNIRHWDVIVDISSDLIDLQACTVPIRLVCGTKSNPVAHAISNHLNKLIPNSEKYEIEGASHFLVTSHTNQCLDVIVG